MDNKRILYTNTDGSLSIIIPAPGITQAEALRAVPHGAVYEIVDIANVPNDRTFRNAWKHDPVVKVDVDVLKAKDITHVRRRAKRAVEFAPHDEVIMKQIPGNDLVVAEQARVAIRSKYATLQIEIDGCTNAESLKALIDREVF